MDAAVAVEKEKKKRERKKRGDGLLPGLARARGKVTAAGKELGELVTEVQAAITRREAANARLVKIVRTVYGGKFEGGLKNSIAVSSEDLAFVREEFGFNV